MEFYWVNVGATIKEVLDGDFLWAPEASTTESGKVRHLDHWDNVAQVKAGDLIFCCHGQHMREINQNRKSCSTTGSSRRSLFALFVK
jgi:putative restriction endonuclease